MFELFKNRDPKEIEMLWTFRDVIDDISNQDEVLNTAISTLNQYYGVQKILISDTVSYHILEVAINSIRLKKRHQFSSQNYKFITISNTHSIFYICNNTSQDNENIIKYYLTLALKKITKITINDKLKLISSKDALTGLYNRRFLNELCNMITVQHKMEQTMYSIIMIDIDHFKSVNDNYGHQIGDDVIKALSLLIQNRCRDSDIAARYGGEEFILLLFDTCSRGAEVVAKDLLVNFRNIEFNTDNKPFKSTISCGISTLNTLTPDIKQVIKKADEALYKSKKTGRDKVTIL